MGAMAVFFLLPISSFAETSGVDFQLLFSQPVFSSIKVRGTYNSIHKDGSDNVRFHDPEDAFAGSSAPWVILSARAIESLDLGIEFFSVRARNEGEISKKIHAGPFQFFVNAATTDHYNVTVGRLWGRYMSTERFPGLSLTFGITAIQARIMAEANGLGQDSAKGLLPLPMLGLAWHQSGPFGTALAISSDYAQIDVNGIHGKASDLYAMIEKPLAAGFSAGVGYKRYAFMIRGGRPLYNANFIQSFSSPLIFVRQNF